MDQGALTFTIDARSGSARLGSLTTPHGTVRTPAFVVVGTQAAVKGVPPGTVAEVGTQLLFANTYHLYLRPGAEVVERHGGLHRFMNWHGPILTDSGGFQVFSLGASIEHGVGKVASIFPGEAPPRRSSGTSMVHVGEDSVRFKSHIDGSLHTFSPEVSIAVQRSLGADMVLAFDECTSPLHDETYTRRSMQRTHRWAERSLAAFDGSFPHHGYPQALFGVVQGGAFEDLRRESAATIGAMPFDGMAIGGNLGSTLQDMYAVLDWTVPALPEGKPRHLLGIGDVPSILEAVERGVDTFDCVTPTRNARTGAAFVRQGDDGERPNGFRINLRNARFAQDLRPLEDGCDCPTCRSYSRAYVRHLFKANEQLAQQLVTVHNLRFMARLMADIRGSIENGRFGAFKAELLGGS
ncbi:MAG: tRNA guanosine(34) transglycosylase Tgt [Deinococcales bacterium]